MQPEPAPVPPALCKLQALAHVTAEAREIDRALRTPEWQRRWKAAAEVFGRKLDRWLASLGE